MTTTLRYGWACITVEHLDGCDAHGDGPRSDSAAAKHTKTTGHATSSFAVPQEGA